MISGWWASKQSEIKQNNVFETCLIKFVLPKICSMIPTRVDELICCENSIVRITYQQNTSLERHYFSDELLLVSFDDREFAMELPLADEAVFEKLSVGVQGACPYS